MWNGPRSLLCALATCASACSLVAVTPPAEPPQPPGDCTTSFAAPGLDLLGTIGAGIVAVAGLYLYVKSGDGCTGNDCGAAGGAGIVFGVPAAILTGIYGYSTVHGHHAVDRCVRLRAREERRAAQSPM